MGKSEMQDLLLQIETILKKHNVKPWLEIFQAFERQLSETDDENGKRAFLQRLGLIYGGMGTFGDVYINHIAGHDIQPHEEVKVNTKFQELRTRLYLLIEEEKAKGRPLD